MGTPLTRMRSVLQHHVELDEDGTVGFHNGTVYDPDDLPTKLLEFLAVDWDDMGQPETITVTIEPGDALNDPTHPSFAD